MSQDSMNIALPDTMKEFVLQQVSEGGYSTASEYVRDLIRADQKRKAEIRLDRSSSATSIWAASIRAPRRQSRSSKPTSPSICSSWAISSTAGNSSARGAGYRHTPRLSIDWSN